MTISGKSPVKQRTASPVKATTSQLTPPRNKKSDRRQDKITSKKNDSQPMDIEDKKIKSELIDSANKNIITPQKSQKKETPSPKKTVTITSDSIVSYLASLQDEETKSLTDQQLRSLVEMWYKKYHKDIKILQNWSRDLFLIEIDDIIEDAQSVIRGEKIKIRVEKNVNELNKKISSMLKKKFKKLEEFDSFSREVLNHYYHDYSKTITKKPVIMSDIKSWTDDEMKQELSITLDKSKNRSPSPKKKSKTKDESKQKSTQPSNNPKPKSNNSPKPSEPKPTPHQTPKSFETFDIDVNSDPNILNNDQLVELYCILRANAGFPQNSSTIRDTWSEEMLRKTISTMQAQMHPDQTKKSTLKPSKYSSKSNSSHQANLNGQTLNTCRYTLNFELPKGKKGVSGLRAYLSDIFHEMGSYCEDIAILPWDTENLEDAIDDSEDLPTKIKELQRYFKDAKSYENGGYVFSKIRLGFPISNPDKATFEHNLRGWLQNNSIRMYECAVQHRKVCTCAWLLYAPGTLDQKKWSTAIMDIYRKTHTKRGTEIKVGLVWRALNGQKSLDRKEKTYAMHVETPVHQRKVTKKFLRTLAAHKRWPLGLRFRVVDEFFIQMKDSTKQKYRYCKDRHASFLKNLGRSDCSQILNLDKKIKLPSSDKYTTLRYIILGIKDNVDNRRIFATVDEKYNSDDLHVLTFRPDKSTKANGFVDSLSTYVLHKFPSTSFEGILSIDSIEQAKYEKFDPNTQAFTTEDDIDLDMEIQADLDDDSFEYLNDDTIANPYEFEATSKIVGSTKMWNLTGEEDTVSAMTASSVSFTNDSTCMYYDSSEPASRPTSSVQEGDTVASTITNDLSESIPENQPVTKQTKSPNTSERITDLEQQLILVQQQLARARAAPSSEPLSKDAAKGK